jgi:hypothetical protein
VAVKILWFKTHEVTGKWRRVHIEVLQYLYHLCNIVRFSELSSGIYCHVKYIPEDNSEHHTRHRENLKSHVVRLITSGSMRWADHTAQMGKE